MRYPDTPTVEQVDELHGTRVADPYRWLEDVDSLPTADWLTRQRALTAAWFAASTRRDGLRARLTQLWDHPRRGAPWRVGDRWFQLRNRGLQPQEVLWTMPAPDADGAVLLDPNTWTDDGTAALTGLAVSRDGSTIAYARSERGSDWQTWRVRRIGRDADEPDVVEWSKFSGAAWAPDGSGFWYGAYAPPDPDGTHRARTEGQRLRFHRLGTPTGDDRVVAEQPDDPAWGFAPQVSHDGRWLVVTVWRGTDPHTRVHVADLDGDGAVRPLLDDFDAEYRAIEVRGDELLVLTDREAPTRRVVAVPLADPRPAAWREVVAATDDTIEQARLVGDRLVVVRLRDATHAVAVHGADGGHVGDVDLGRDAAVTGLSGRPDDTVVHLVRATWTRPEQVIAHDLGRGATSTLFAPPVAGAPAELDLRTRQVFVTSSDGAAVPLTIVHRADVDPDRTGTPARTILYGYGGFGISVTPSYSAPWRAWVERGGVVAVANLRGGGEYGQAWHDAGRRGNKQQVFDDAVACAGWLVDAGWTTHDRLAIEGRSNGGLLVGACLTQRPELFGAAVAVVGVLDMLRFHRFTIGWAWTSDYGDPDDPDDFAVLHAYSPLHRVRPGTAYPATLLVTGDHDDRVVPAHSLKFAAALQAAQAADAPVLLRLETSGGHGVGKPTEKVIGEWVDILAFCEAVLPAGPDPQATDDEDAHGE